MGNFCCDPLIKTKNCNCFITNKKDQVEYVSQGRQIQYFNKAT